MTRQSARVKAAILVLTIGIILISSRVDALAQDPQLYMDIADVAGHVGQTIIIPLYIQTLEDTLDGFQITLALSRPDLLYFEVDTVITGDDSIFVCQFDTSGTLTSGWEHIEARSRGATGLDLRLSGISELPDIVVTPGMPDYTAGTLMRIYGRIRNDIPDTLSNRVVDLNVHNGTTYYSNQDGALILPVQNLNGSVYVEEGMQGDVNCDANVNPIDAVLLVNYVYRNRDVLCNTAFGDLNCDTAVNPIDVVILVNHVYKNWPMPPC